MSRTSRNETCGCDIAADGVRHLQRQCLPAWATAAIHRAEAGRERQRGRLEKAQAELLAVRRREAEVAVLQERLREVERAAVGQKYNLPLVLVNRRVGGPVEELEADARLLVKGLRR